jgi:hypothetical protein
LDDNTLVLITVSRNKGKISYKVDCAKEVKSEELAHYLDEIIEGICTWKPAVCEETVQSFIGTIEVANGKNKKIIRKAPNFALTMLITTKLR